MLFVLLVCHYNACFACARGTIAALTNARLRRSHCIPHHLDYGSAVAVANKSVGLPEQELVHGAVRGQASVFLRSGGVHLVPPSGWRRGGARVSAAAMESACGVGLSCGRLRLFIVRLCAYGCVLTSVLTIASNDPNGIVRSWMNISLCLKRPRCARWSKRSSRTSVACRKTARQSRRPWAWTMVQNEYSTCGRTSASASTSRCVAGLVSILACSADECFLVSRNTSTSFALSAT